MKLFRRSISVLLAALMAFSQPIMTLADTEAAEPTYIGGERLSDVPEGNYVYLGNTAVTLREGNGSFSVPIYREGDNSERAWVKIHTIDLTSVYGRDYRVEGRHKEEHAGKKNIFQLLAEDNNSDSVEVKNYEFSLDRKATQTEYADTDTSSDGAAKPAADDEQISAESEQEEGIAADDGTAALDGGFDSMDDAFSVEEDGIDINDDSLVVTDVKAVSSDRISNQELVQSYSNYQALTAEANAANADTGSDAFKSVSDAEPNASGNGSAENEAAVLTASKKSSAVSASEADGKVIIAPKKATATEYSDDYEASEAELIDQKAVVDEVSSEAQADDGISELAKLKYAQTGIATREGVPTAAVNNNLTDQLFGAIAPEYMSLISYSCEQTIYLEPGEDEAEFTFRLYDNAKSDGSRMFSVIITETSDNVETYKSANMSVLIEDDEETGHSKLSFAADTFDGSDNSAEIRIVRSELLQTMATAVLTAENSDTGETSALGELVFAPYETEKKVKLNITHDSILRLTELTAADEGDITSAIVKGTDNISGDYGIEVASDMEDRSEAKAAALSDDGAVALASDSSSSSGSSAEKEFTIKVNEKNLVGKYKNGDLKATLYDESYDPALAVGDYFFAVDDKNGGILSYDPLHLEGDQPGWQGEAAEAFVFESKEAEADKDFRKSHGWAHYYTREKASKEGRVKIEPRLDLTSPINALYYQYIAPEMEMGETFALIHSDEWTSFRIGPKSFYTSGQPADQVEKYVHHIIGKFDRGVKSPLAVKITTENSLLYPMASAEDNCAWVCKTMFNIWGMAAMYKKYKISVEDTEDVAYKSADGKTETKPYQVKIKCGALNPSDSSLTRDFYVNPASENSNLVFTVQPNNINGSIGTFGKLSGYRITAGINPKTAKTVNYPSDFINFMKDSSRVSTDAIDYSSEAVEKEIKKVNNDIAIVPVDIYFVDWMNSVSQEVQGDGMDGRAYYQQLKFKPVIEYIDVDVQVTEPSIAGKGLSGKVAHFKDSELKAGTTKTYHAGDMLDLSAVADSDAYRVLGYEVSVDGGVKFNHIEDSSQLILQAGKVKGYIIRPEVAPKSNYIEVEYEAGTSGFVHADNLVPQSALKDYPDLKGKNILDVNPQAKNIYDRIYPTVGKAYSIDIVVDKAAKGSKTVRPTVKDGDNGKTYTTNKYYFLARNAKDNNKFKIGTKLSEPGDVHDYTLSGSAVTKAVAVRQDGKGYNILPTRGYTIMAGSGQVKLTDKTTKKEVQTVNVSSSAVADNGTFTLTGKSGENGDLITVLCSNGLGDDQIIEVKLGINKDKDGKFVDNAGQLVMGYPVTAPEIKTVTYSYDKPSSSQSVTLNESQIRLLDDTLKLTAVVDNKGHDIEAVKFVVRDSSGSTKELTAAPQNGKSNNVFEVSVKNMLNYFHSGDKIYAYIVDKASVDINFGTTTKKQQITYPQVDTGLSTYVENEKITPKTFSQDNDAKSLMSDVNLPVIGGPSSAAQSGLISFNKTWHEGHKSYSLTANIDALYDNIVDSAADKAKRAQGTHENLLEAHKQRKDKLQKKNDVLMNEDAFDQTNQNDALEALLGNDMMKDNKVADNRADNAESKAKELLTETYPRYAVNVYLCVDLEFVLNEQTGEYLLSMWSVVIGGKYSIEQVYYNFIMYIPVFIDLQGMIQLNVYFGSLTDGFKTAAREGDFDNYTGNLKDMADGATVVGGTDATFIGRFQVGAGVVNCLSIRGGISLTFQFQFAQLGAASKDWAGAVLGVSGSIGIDLVVTQFNWTFGTAQKGWGTLSNRTQVEWLWPTEDDEKTTANDEKSPNASNGVKQDSSSGNSSGSNSGNSSANNSTGATFPSYVGENSSVHGGLFGVSLYGFGSDLFSTGDEGFGKSIRSGGLLRSVLSADEDDLQILKKNAADRTRPQLIALDEDKSRYMLLFIGLGKDTTTGKDTAQLYYSINKRGGLPGFWSAPVPVDAENCHYDASPDVIEVSPNVFMAAWLDAREPVDASANAEDFKKAYTAFDVSAAVFDFNDNSTEPKVDTFKLSSDYDSYGADEKRHYFNMAPKLIKAGRQIYCTYIKRDISGAESLEELTDMTKSYSAVAYVCYDPDYASVSGKQLSGEKFFSQHWEGKDTDPFITNYAAEGFSCTNGLTNSNYVAVAYVIDGDNDLSTTDDRNMYLSLYNMSKKIAYYPVKLTNDIKTQTMLQMNTLNDNTYLTWIEQGGETGSDQRFAIMNISEAIDELLNTEGISERFYPNDTFEVQTPTEYRDKERNKDSVTVYDDSTATPTQLTHSRRKAAATPTEYAAQNETDGLKAVADSQALDSRVLRSALAASMNALSVAYASQGDMYNSSGWKPVADKDYSDWQMSGNDWYMVDEDELKDDLISYSVNSLKDAYGSIYTREKAEEAYDDIYNSWVVGRIKDYNLPKDTAILADNNSRVSHNVNEYKLVSDGTYIYVFYDDFCDDVTHIGQELFAMRYSDSTDEYYNGDGSSDSRTGESQGFTEPVMLTEYDKIIDEFDIAEGADEGTLRVVSNLYDVTTGQNDLAYISFKQKGSIKPVKSSIDISEHIVRGEKTELSFDLKNEGLYTSEGCSLKVELTDKDGKTLENIKVPADISDYLGSLEIEPGDSVNVTIPWTPGRNLDNTRIKITAAEKLSGIFDFDNDSYSASKAVPYETVIEISDYTLSYEDGRLNITAKVSNHGNKDADELKLVLKRLGISIDEDRELMTQTLSGGLKSGEEKQISFIYTPKADDFDGFERIKLQLSAVCSEETLAKSTEEFTDSKPVLCEIEGGAKSINAAVGENRQLDFKAAPYNELAGEVMFTSSDPTVAYVDESGMLHALKDGTVTITLYYPSLGISTEITVVVGTGKAANASDAVRNSSRYSRNSSGSGTISVGAGIPSGAIYGQWTYHPENDRWTFASGNRQYRNEWAYLYNPYAQGIQSRADWFRFDADGYMVTGWYTDTDGNRYYLWPYSDNVMGHMVTGWLPIGISWYYFNPVSTGTKGALYRSTTTLDGYRVDADGKWIE